MWQAAQSASTWPSCFSTQIDFTTLTQKYRQYNNTALLSRIKTLSVTKFSVT